MKIEVLAMDNFAPSLQSWTLSRDLRDFPTIESVAPVDAPVNEMPSAFLHFRDFMILEREIFVAPRSHVVWARTSRVDDPLLFSVPPEFFHADQENLRKAMERDWASGLSQDAWRQHLPLVALTNWTTRISFRDLVKLEGYFRYLAKIPLFERRFTEVANAMLRVVDRFTTSHALTAEVVKSMKPVRFLSENEIVFNEEGTFKSDNFTVLKVSVPISLRAQLVRHRNLQFVDSFLSLLMKPNVQLATIGELVDMEISAPDEIWRSVIAKRSCWIAQADLWQTILEKFSQENFSRILPCADGKCPYAKDAALRFTDADPGMPCPRYANLNGIDKAPFAARMMKEATARGQFWTDEVNK